MYNLNIRIAEHVVFLSTDSEPIKQYLKGKFWNTRLEEAADTPDLSIFIENGYGVAFKDYDVRITSEGDKIRYERADYRIEADSNYVNARISVYDDFALKHALLTLYSAFITHNCWGLLIHSSCVVDKNQAYLFAGQSGAGKSTVVQLSAPRQILSDEAAIVKVIESDIKVFNSPFRSDSETPYFSGCYVLAAIQLLRQSLENRRIRMGKMEGVLELLNKVFYWAHDPEETRKVLHMCKELIREVPLYELYFQKNNTFWEEIS